ncbi:MAG: hypothetical protein ACI9UA_001704 [Pseudoalteromonas tetraodonis]|jgi:hypothetical protein
MVMRTLAILFFASSLSAQAGWETLFNGKDFTNFGAAGEREKNGYLVKDGVIESTPKCSNLMTDKKYADYILEFEFQLTPGANNGLGIHYPGHGNPSSTGMELQILDNTADKYKNLKDYQFHGSLYTLEPALRGHLKPVGEWNSQRVTCRGPRVTVELNGVCITDANLDELNKSHAKHSGAKRRSGHICFAGHGDVIRVRKMRIAELSFAEDQKDAWYQPAGKADDALAGLGFTQLFDGKSLQGFVKEEKNVGHWMPKDGWILDYDGKSGDLWTEKEYKDFTVVADWRWTGDSGKRNQPDLLPNGLQKVGADRKGVTVEIVEVDSGIFLRGEGRTQVNLWNWPIGSGEVYGIRTDRSQPLPIRAALTPRVFADKPIGKWNRFVITVKGDRLTVVLNGKVVLHEAQLPGVKPQGKLAFQHHGNPLQFANIFVKELE